jgi:hypothetical protein
LCCHAYDFKKIPDKKRTVVSTPKSVSPTKAEKLMAVKGMNDILPPESARWEWLEAKVRDLMARYAYRNIRTPIVEHTPLFVRGLGEVTDIVEKEMYSFEDRLNGASHLASGSHGRGSTGGCRTFHVV